MLSKKSVEDKIKLTKASKVQIKQPESVENKVNLISSKRVSQICQLRTEVIT